MSAFKLLLQYLLATAFAAPVAVAFTIAPIVPSQRSTALPATSLPEQRSSSWLELPKKEVEFEPLEQGELWTGRIAMVGALGFIVQEVFTGESIAEQCTEAFQSLL
jgi:hypothetical protein